MGESSVSDQIVLSTQGKVTRIYYSNMVLDMKPQHLRHTKMALLSAIGAHFLTWADACLLTVICQNNCEPMQSKMLQMHLRNRCFNKRTGQTGMNRLTAEFIKDTKIWDRVLCVQKRQKKIGPKV